MKFHFKQSLLASNLRSNTYNDDNLKSGSHDDHLCKLEDLITSSSQEFDSYEDPYTYSHKITMLQPS